MTTGTASVRLPAASARRTSRLARLAMLTRELGGPAIFGIVLLTILLVGVALAGQLAPANPTAVNVAQKLRPPGAGTLLGTDFFGRDIASRLLWGGRITLLVGVAVIGLASVVGIPLGLLAGQRGGLVDEVLMRIADALLAFPSLVLAIAIASTLGPSLQNAMLAVAIAYVPQFMRVARGQARAVATLPYVESARAVGAGDGRLLLRHVAPNCLGPLAVQASLNLAGAILATASLGFLGLGVQAPMAEWGADVAANTVYIRESPWPSLWPGLAIILAALAVNLMADGLVDYLNPRLRQR